MSRVFAKKIKKFFYPKTLDNTVIMCYNYYRKKEREVNKMLCKNCEDNKTCPFIENFDDNTVCIYDMLTQYKVDKGIITDEKIVKKFSKNT